MGKLQRKLRKQVNTIRNKRMEKGKELQNRQKIRASGKERRRTNGRNIETRLSMPFRRTITEPVCTPSNQFSIIHSNIDKILKGICWQQIRLANNEIVIKRTIKMNPDVLAIHFLYTTKLKLKINSKDKIV